MKRHDWIPSHIIILRLKAFGRQSIRSWSGVKVRSELGERMQVIRTLRHYTTFLGKVLLWRRELLSSGDEANEMVPDLGHVFCF